MTRRILLAIGLLSLSIPAFADIVGPPAGAYIRDQSQPQANAVYNVSSGTVRGQLTVTDLVLLGSCSGCPSGGGGSGPTGQINTAAQFRVPYYSVSGSSNVLSGDANLTYVPASQLLTVTTLAANTVSPKSGTTVTILNPTVSTITTTGNNVLIGPSGMPAAVSPNDLIAIGRQALASNVSGLNNVAVGSYALSLSTSTSGAVAIGYGALRRFSPGNYATGVVAIGQSALENFGQNNGAVYATAVGYGAAQNATTGNVLTAVGYSAAVNNRGDYTTAVGAQALPAHTTGDFNSAFGAAAGIMDSTGTANTYIGAYAGYSNTGGNYNTYVGNNAGIYHLGSGNYNTGVGLGALQTVYGSQNTALGAGAGVQDSGASPINYSAAIGWGAVVMKSNAMMLGSDNPTYTMDVGIATSTPREKLHVAGGNIRLDSANSFKFYDSDNSNFVALKANPVTTSNVTWTLPAADAAGCFQSDGAGNVTLATCGSGGGGGSVNGTIVASPQFRLPYYSLAGTTTTIQGDANITTDGSGVLSAFQIVSKPRTGTAGNVQLQNAAGNAQGTISNPGATGESKIDINALNGITLTGPVTGSTMTLTQRLIFGDGTFITSTSTLVGTSGINNQSTLQSGAQFNVSTGAFNVGVLFSTASNTALMRMVHWSGTGYTKLFHVWPRTSNQVNQDLFVGQGAGNNYAGAASGNVGIGPTALAAVTSGSGNVGLGNYAGAYYTTGSENIAIGNQSALNAVSGAATGNVTIGGGQVAPNLGTNYNTIIGYHAGWMQPEFLGGGRTIGDGNVMLGNNSALAADIDNTISVGNNTVIYGTNSIAIGYQATIATGAVNAIALGYGAFNDVSNSMVIGGSSNSATAMNVTAASFTATNFNIVGFPQNVPLYVDLFGNINARAIRLDTSDATNILPVIKGGTGQDSYTDGQLLIGNTASGSLDKATLTAGSNITITNAGGSITIAASGGGSSGPVSLSTGVVGLLSLSTQTVGTLPVANGGTNLTAAADDNVMVGNGTTWQTKAIGDCDDTGGNHLNYDTGTNAFSCGTSGSGGGGAGYALEPSTVSVQLAKGVYLGTNTVTAGSAYTITSTDTVVFAQGSLSANPVTYTLPSAASACRNGTGQTIQITKVDTSTGAVKVKTAGSDLILGTTGQVMLNAMGQTAEMISDCNSKWWPHGQGIQTTPAYIGFNGDGGNGNTKISSTTYVCPMTVTVPVAVMGFSWYVQTAAAGSFATLSIYDSNLNLVVSTGPILVGSFGANSTTITPVNLPPGQYYYGWQQAVASVAISDDPSAGNGGNGSNYCSSNTDTDLVPPNPFVLGTASAKPGPAINIRIAGGRTGL